MFALCEARLRSFTICKQACIVLAGTSFATTKALAFQRSAELARSFKNLFLKTEALEDIACVFIQTPSPFGYSLLSNRESFNFRFISLLMSVLGLVWVAYNVQRNKLYVIQIN